jgi:ketosteroid isomerase-like protein
MSIQKIEDQLALKKLVDTFSNLADTKDTKAQIDLFTDDAEVISKADGKTFVSKGKKDIEKAFADYLKLFDVVYHLNGQQTVEINGDNATGISYCFVTLIGNGKKNQSGVRYHDTYVKQNGKWLIKKRESDFMYTSVDDMKKA